MNFLDSGETAFLAATAYFAAFVVMHVFVALLVRRFDGVAPRDASKRARLAQRVGALHGLKAGWFAVLFTVAGITVIAATPKLPLLEIITVYGGLIGVVFSLWQAVDWYRAASRIHASHLALSAIAVHDGAITETVAVRMPLTVLERITAGEPLSATEVSLILDENPREVR